MAIVYVDTNKNYSELTVATGDTITPRYGGVLTVDTSTVAVARFGGGGYGKTIFNNTSTTTPIFIKLYAQTAYAYLNPEGAQEMYFNGDFIDLGISNGSASQTFTLPTDASGEKYDNLAGVFVDTVELERMKFACVPTLSDKKGNIYEGRLFTHNITAGTITFGNGTNGYIPPLGSKIRIPNIQVKVIGTVADARLDVTSSGYFYARRTSFSYNFSMLASSSRYFDVEECVLSGYLSPLSGTYVVNVSNNQKVSFNNNIVSWISRYGCLFANADNAEIENNLCVNSFSATTSPTYTLAFQTVNNSKMRGNEAMSFYSLSNSYGVILHTLNIGSDISGSFASGYMPFRFLYLTSEYINNLRFNGNPTTNYSYNTQYGIYADYINNCIIDDVSSIFTSTADGGMSPSLYALYVGSYSSGNTFNNMKLFTGESSLTSTYITSYLINDNGANNTYANISFYGGIRTYLANIADRYGIILKNIFMENAETVNASPTEWGNDNRIEWVSSSSTLSTPSGEGTGTRSITRYTVPGSRASGSIDVKYSCVESVGTTTGYYDNTGKHYMPVAGEQYVLETFVHKGIQSFSGTPVYTGTTSNITIEFDMRNAGGEYTGTYGTLNQTNLQSKLNSLTGYNSNIGLQIKFRFTVTTSSVSNNMQATNIPVTVDPNYREYYEPPTLERDIKDIIADTNAVVNKIYPHARNSAMNTTPQ